MAEGLHAARGLSLAAQRMAWPITASTATTLAAFLPLLFWPGIVGEFMKYLPITLLATLAASLLMALVFVPMLGALFGKAEASDPDDHAAALGRRGSGDLDELRGLDRRAMCGCCAGLLERPGDGPRWRDRDRWSRSYVAYGLVRPRRRVLPRGRAEVARCRSTPAAICRSLERDQLVQRGRGSASWRSPGIDDGLCAQRRRASAARTSTRT